MRSNDFFCQVVNHWLISAKVAIGEGGVLVRFSQSYEWWTRFAGPSYGLSRLFCIHDIANQQPLQQL